MGGVPKGTTVSTHATVNDSLEFVNPVTGVHAQHVESYWNRVKTKFKGVHDTMLSSSTSTCGGSAMGRLVLLQ